MFDKLITFFAKRLPDSCIFEMDFSFLGARIYIPPLCKLNPLYSQIMKKKLELKGYIKLDEKLKKLGINPNYVKEIPEDVFDEKKKQETSDDTVYKSYRQKENLKDI